MTNLRENPERKSYLWRFDNGDIWELKPETQDGNTFVITNETSHSFVAANRTMNQAKELLFYLRGVKHLVEEIEV